MKKPPLFPSGPVALRKRISIGIIGERTRNLKEGCKSIRLAGSSQTPSREEQGYDGGKRERRKNRNGDSAELERDRNSEHRKS
jgi:hypothetical protein